MADGATVEEAIANTGMQKKKYLITVLFLIFKGDGIYGITKLY